jgi:hypothetical protein
MARLLPRRGARIGLAVVLAVSLALGGCGDDDAAPPQGTAARSAQGGATGAAGGPPKTQLAIKPHIEEHVACPRPDQPSDPKGGKCDPKAPSCGEHLYCLQLAQGSYCEPCPERDGIRHAFRERDFDSQHNRDPFQRLSGQSGPTPPPGGPTKMCSRDDQFVASSHSYTELKLVGVVAQGTQRKVLMTLGNDGYIIKRGDCVGKEKAVVKDIGLGYVTFQGDPDEYSVQLYPKPLVVDEPVSPAPVRRTMPSPVAPPPVPPLRAPAGSNAAPVAPGTAPPAGTAPAGATRAPPSPVPKAP